MRVDLKYKNLKSLEGIHLPDGLTTLNLNGNLLTSLPPLPPTLTHLHCSRNKLTSLPSLPPSLEVLDCGGNQLISLPPLPPSLIELDCGSNRLINLPPLPPSLTNLICYCNRLTSLPPLPRSLTKLYWIGNPLALHYCEKGELKTIEELRVIIQVDRWRRALFIVSRMIRDRSARNIQRVWRRYWLVPYFDPQLGYMVSRYLLHYKHEL